MKTLLFLALVGLTTSGSILPLASAQYVQENLPMPNIGDRKLTVQTHSYLRDNQTRFLQFRFFDNNTNQTISHITSFIVISDKHHILLADNFHAESRIIILKIMSSQSNNTRTLSNFDWAYFTKEYPQYNNYSPDGWSVINVTREPILGGWESTGKDGIINVQSSSFFNSNYTYYHLHLILYDIDNDDQMFPQNLAPRFDGNIDSTSNFSEILYSNTNTMPTNSTKTPNGDWITPLQTTNSGGKRLDTHVEQGIDGSGKTMLPPVTENMGLPQQFQTPLKQFKSGIPVSDVKCAEGFTLVLKSENDSPACVKPDTAQKLIERGWGHFPPRLHQ